MRKRLVLLLLAVLGGTMFVVGLIIMAGVPTDVRFSYPIPIQSVVGGSIAMFATVIGFLVAFIESATQKA